MCAHDQSCPTLCDPMDFSLQESSVHGIFQARLLEWVAISSVRGSSQPRGWTYISCIFWIGKWIVYQWATQEALWEGIKEGLLDWTFNKTSPRNWSLNLYIKWMRKQALYVSDGKYFRQWKLKFKAQWIGNMIDVVQYG